MRGPRIRYRRQKACERHHPRTPEARAPSGFPAQQRRLDRAQSLISMLVALTDRCHGALLLSPQPRLIADSADVLAPRSTFLQSAVDRTVPAWDWILRHRSIAPLCGSLCGPFATMIDPLETTANYLDSGRLDEAEIICGTVPKTKPDDSSALRLMQREATQLYVEPAIVHRGPGARGAAVRAAQQAFSWHPTCRTATKHLMVRELRMDPNVFTIAAAPSGLRRDTTRSQFDASGKRVRCDREEIHPINFDPDQNGRADHDDSEPVGRDRNSIARSPF
jgi:hypothetical protein